MAEKELMFMCAYTDCGKVTTVIVKVSKPIPTKSKSVTRAYYCEHCNRANKIEVPDNVDVHVFILGKDKGFLRYTDDGIPPASVLYACGVLADESLLCDTSVCTPCAARGEF